MVRSFFELEDHADLRGRWYLNGLRDSQRRELDSEDFCNCLPVDLGPPLRISLTDEDKIIEVEVPMKVSLRRKGRPLDFTFADFDMPVVTERVADIISGIADADIQRIPVGVASRKEKYEIINVISRFDCIDDRASEIEWWTKEDGRPDKLGKPRMITKLVIDPKRVHKSHIFRPEGWEIVVIVSDLLKTAFEDAKVSGVQFTPV